MPDVVPSVRLLNTLHFDTRMHMRIGSPKPAVHNRQRCLYNWYTIFNVAIPTQLEHNLQHCPSYTTGTHSSTLPFLHNWDTFFNTALPKQLEHIFQHWDTFFNTALPPQLEHNLQHCPSYTTGTQSSTLPFLHNWNTHFSTGLLHICNTLFNTALPKKPEHTI